MKPEPILDMLLCNRHLSLNNSKAAFQHVLERAANEPQILKTFLLLLQKKGESPDEIAGLIQCVRSREKQLPLKPLPYLIDTCGTGGDQSHTFNISTVAALIAAGAGAHVAKHGNKGISSKCGSADLLEGLGINIYTTYPRMRRALEQTGFGYFHAPLYHPIFQKIQTVRRELGKKKIRTIFNISGPLLNPLRIKNQVIGVFKKELVSVLGETCRKIGMKRVLIVWNSEGLDELGTRGKSFVSLLIDGRLQNAALNIKKLNLRKAAVSDLKGGTIKANKKIALDILSGKDKSLKREIALLNAAAVLWISGKAENLKEGLVLAGDSLNTKKALNVLRQLIRISHGT